MLRTSGERLILPAVILACVGCLQPGIDPVFLTLLSAAHGLKPDFHGWVVSATQSGMAIGSLMTWRWGTRLPLAGFALAAGIAALAALATAHTAHFTALLAIRGLYGAAMGVLYTQAMSHAATNRPHGAYGAVFLCQLMLSSGIALALPAIADAAGPTTALSALAAAPIAALVLVMLFARSTVKYEAQSTLREPQNGDEETDLQAWATAGATLLFICATMMVWTFSGALAVKAGISEAVIGQAVALGSLAGAATAVLVMREQPLVPPPVTGLLAGLSLLTPIAATQSGDALSFIIAIILLNIGSTAIIVRSSGLASAASKDSLFRRFVACTHALGMILGPLAGSVATGLFGHAGLLSAAVLAIATACLMLLFAEARSLRMRFWKARPEPLEQFLTDVRY
ncbi:MFS transporter [Novosphingobium mangrovi (ex Huang et al. 2023)]|uniref:MFS transporter n=1 Tax=Novosphingobium mangrovi (ex Huang et al. 2023) TaxID=2976432 RepID=A0ABT2I9K9_9SPHN|nr:MFS transporter [Novosphingobium mangrovi (ex Huang et al. 2023)]MCT2401464.1 MFS transporter [Novosphingobium mangrovi (ex Huang et al. 2023)]